MLISRNISISSRTRRVAILWANYRIDWDAAVVKVVCLYGPDTTNPVVCAERFIIRQIEKYVDSEHMKEMMRCLK